MRPASGIYRRQWIICTTVLRSVLVCRTPEVVSNVDRIVTGSGNCRVAELPEIVVDYGAIVSGNGGTVVDRRPSGSNVIEGVVERRRLVTTVCVAARLVVIEVTQCISLHRYDS